MTQLDAQPLSSPSDTGCCTGRRDWLLLAIPLLFVTLRCVFAPLTELCGDEAYYWVWSRSLSWGYLDHPPMIAFLIRASCNLLGQNAFAVRLPAILLASGTLLSATWMGHLLGLSRRWLFILQAILFCFPMLHVEGAISTPDTPALFFTTLTVVGGLLCLRSPGKWVPWLLLGISSGLAMLSKYTALLPVGAILLYLLAHSPRYWYRVAIAAVLAALVVSPMLYWNQQRYWLSFAFQLNHGTAPDKRAWYTNFGEYFLAQAIVATPLLMPILLASGYKALRKPLSPGHRLIAIASLASFLFFAATSLSHKVEANWPVLTWIPLTVLLVSALPAASPSFARYTKHATILAGIFVFVLMLPPALLSKINKHSPLNQMDGWSQLAHEVRSRADAPLIVCTRYQDASLFAFYLPGQPPVRVLRLKNDRRSQYDYMDPNIKGDFTLVTDDRLQPGRITLYRGNAPYNIDVLNVSSASVDVDGITRSRFFALCRLAPRDAVTQPSYSGRTK